MRLANILFMFSLLLCFATASEDEAAKKEFQKNFKTWKTKYKKNYTSTALEKQAENNFVQNSLNTAKHNKNTNKTYTRGISSHSDMSFEQIKGKRLGLNMFKNSSLKLTPREVISNKTAPDFVDYTSRFLPVKDQRNCSASWAFASTAVVEYWISRSGKNQSFSEQNLIDCDKSSSGCSGGWPTKALNYMKKHGISSDLKYTYKAIDQKCQRIPKRWPPVLKIPNACEVEVAGNEEILKQIIAQIGPVAGVMSVTEGFASYESGVFYDEKCIKASPNHAIAIVGYGNHKKLGDYWIIRNSWGDSWGLKGYAYVARNSKNHCGIALFAMFSC